MRWSDLACYQQQGQPFDVIAWLQKSFSPATAAIQSVELQLALPEQRFPVRLVACALPQEQAEQARRRVRRKAQKNQVKLTQESLLVAGFVLLITNLPAAQWSAHQIVQLYRLRWQVELYFKRLKSILQLDHLRAHDQQLARVYLLAKLLAALVLDRLSDIFLAQRLAWANDLVRPLSLWRLTALLWATLTEWLTAPLSRLFALADPLLLRRYLSNSPRKRLQQDAFARLFVPVFIEDALLHLHCWKSISTRLYTRNVKRMDFFKSLKGPFGVIAVSMFLNAVGFTIIIPVVPFIVAQYVAEENVGLVVGLIMASFALCQFLAAPVLGAISDQRGRRPVLLLSLAGSIIGYVIFGIGGALWVLFLGRIIDGLTGGNISTMYAYVADTIPPQERGRYYGILGAASGFGFIIGPVIGGITGLYSLSMPLYVAAAVTLGNVLWAYFALPESLPAEKRSKLFEWGHLNPFSPFAHVFSSATLRIAFVAAFLFFFGGTMLQSNLSVFLKDILDFGPGGIAAILLLVGVMDILSQGFLTGRLLPIFGEVKLARAGLVVNGVGFLLIGLVAFFPWVTLLVIAIIVFNLGDGLFQPSISGIIANAAPAGAQGRVQGANQGQQAIARILGPLLAAFLYTVTPSGPYFVGAAVILVAVTILSAFPV